MTSHILGIGGFLGHDANVALVSGGEMVFAAQEERFTRIKHDASFPALAAKECLAVASLRGEDVTDVAFAEKPVQTFMHRVLDRPTGRLRSWLGRCVPENFAGQYAKAARDLCPNATFHYAWHHVSHVVGAFVTSPFDDAAFLCVDGKGEDYSATIGRIDRQRISIERELPWENGIGLLYTLVTHFLGFKSFGSEYKVMGLGPYGEPNYVGELLALCETDISGSLRLRFPVTFEPASVAESIHRVEEATGMTRRRKNEPLSPKHVDIAASIQALFQDQILQMAAFARATIESENLLFCGGCAQNCVTAGALRRAGIFERVYNSPVGGDMGSGLGAASVVAAQRLGRFNKADVRGFYLGSEPGSPPAEAIAYEEHFSGSLHRYVAARIAGGETVGWVRGRMELGARALGARSIIADPRADGMQSKLNLAVKFRESFRPFAPAILAEYASDWFDSDEESDFMNYTAALLPKRRFGEGPVPGLSLKQQLDHPRSEVQSVIHVDYSARLQTVRRSVHPDFHKLISAFYDLTGVPILINTSFNVSGEPIVRTASEAWLCFVNTNLDLLVINDHVFKNPGKKTDEEKHIWLKQFSESA